MDEDCEDAHGNKERETSRITEDGSSERYWHIVNSLD
jgi:hypothetical protein